MVSSSVGHVLSVSLKLTFKALTITDYITFSKNSFLWVKWYILLLLDKIIEHVSTYQLDGHKTGGAWCFIVMNHDYNRSH